MRQCWKKNWKIMLLLCCVCIVLMWMLYGGDGNNVSKTLLQTKGDDKFMYGNTSQVKARNPSACRGTVNDILLELSEELLRSGIKLILTQIEDLADESEFVESVFLNVDIARPVTRVGVFGEHFHLFDEAIKHFLKYCPIVQRKEIVTDDPRREGETNNSPGRITTHLFLIIPLNDESIPELEPRKKDLLKGLFGRAAEKPRKFFNWKRIHFQVIYKRGVSTKDQPQAYRWIGAETDDALLFKRAAESYEDFTTRPIRSSTYQNLFEVPRDKRFFIWEKEAAEFKECPVHNETVKKKYQDKPKGKKLTDPEKIRKFMTSMMAVKRLMQKYRIHSWLNCGTLLGWYRQCSIIPGDGDVDYNQFSDPDVYPSLNVDIVNQKDVLRVADKNIILGYDPWNGIYWNFGVTSGVKVDAYMVYSHFLYDMPRRGLIDFTEKVCSADLHGYRVYVLCAEEMQKKILWHNYKPDYMTPK